MEPEKKGRAKTHGHRKSFHPAKGQAAEAVPEAERELPVEEWWDRERTERWLERDGGADVEKEREEKEEKDDGAEGT